MSITCAICDQPVESRKSLAILIQMNLKFKAVHYLCHAKDQLNRGKAWMTLTSSTVNSMWKKYIAPTLWFMGMYFIMRFDVPKTLPILVITTIAAVPILPAIICYFKYERKVPK